MHSSIPVNNQSLSKIPEPAKKADDSAGEMKALGKAINTFHKTTTVKTVGILAAAFFASFAIGSAFPAGIIAVKVLTAAFLPPAIPVLLIATASVTAAFALLFFFSSCAAGAAEISRERQFEEKKFLNIFDYDSMVRDFNAGKTIMQNRTVNFPLETKQDLVDFHDRYQKRQLQRELLDNNLELLNTVLEQPPRNKQTEELIRKVKSFKDGEKITRLSVVGLSEEIIRREVGGFTLSHLIQDISHSIEEIRTIEHRPEDSENLSKDGDPLYLEFLEKFETKAYETYQTAFQAKEKSEKTPLSREIYLISLRKAINDFLVHSQELAILESVIKNPGDRRNSFF